MIVSHQHRYVFVHVPKNAGTTIATHLAKYLGPRDLMLGSWTEALAGGAKLNRRMTNIILRNRSPFSVIRSAVRRRSIAKMLDTATKRHFSNKLWDHSSLAEIEAHEAFDDGAYFKFCVVRNPFERLVSLYNWRYRNFERRPSFSTMLRLIDDGCADMHGINWQTWDLYTRDNKIAVDFVARQEQLAADFGTICSQIGIPYQPENLTREKSNAPKNHVAASYYKPGDREIVERVYADEIEHFGYRFPN
ncbi:sulfotransferase family protein [Mesorhizobium sp. RP14(2022)]|uniref:Sulfotransferase family protein n=1 Tax=Mesorhizobium liriopis TaxID=2953882 RepID=A0ABT1C5R0_9HYPH|nr:sulfotransferase family 2 domain-containing protein [Mesorhizobium liriopis]MCO6050177.1 sulfotransferase family protein [Mesorhizobium liriopis]